MMTETTTLEKLDEFYGLFENALQNKNKRKISLLINDIKSYEDLFVRNYSKRKREGVFYTGKIIANFIAKEVIIQKINNYLYNEGILDKNLKKIEDLWNLDSSLKRKIHKSLLNISICDPACGSGAFLLSMAEVIFGILKNLETNKTNSKLKLQILENLHGLDINEHAIKFCSIRLVAWLFEDDTYEYKEVHSILNSNLKLANSITNSEVLQRRFDIIIGNPPYGNILSFEEKEQLKKEKIFYNDIYCAFLLKTINWSNGIIAFLIPKSFLLRQGYIRFRNKFLSKVNIVKIIDIGPNVFKDATNEVQILIYEKKEDINKDLEVFDYPHKEIITYPNQNYDSLRICFNNNCPMSERSKKIYIYTFNKRCPHCNSETVQLNRIRIKPTKDLFKIVNKIEKQGNLNYLNIVDFPKMIRGEEDKGLKHVRNLLENNINRSCVFINAKEDFQYYYLDKKKSFKIEDISEKSLKGNNYEYYKGPKLLIKHNNIIPEAIYTEDTVCFTSSIYSLLHKDKSEMLYLCAVLNSALIQFYCMYGINNQKHTTINLNQYMIRHLPIVKPNNSIKLKIAERVGTIQTLLRNNEGNLNLEIIRNLKEVDDIFFNLYSISDNERKLILSDIKKHISHFNKIYPT